MLQQPALHISGLHLLDDVVRLKLINERTLLGPKYFFISRVCDVFPRRQENTFFTFDS